MYPDSDKGRMGERPMNLRKLTVTVTIALALRKVLHFLPGFDPYRQIHYLPQDYWKEKWTFLALVAGQPQRCLR